MPISIKAEQAAAATLAQYGWLDKLIL